MDPAIIWTFAQKELRDALRNRWFLLYTLSFIVLSVGLSYLALAGAGMTGVAGFGRTSASLINLILLIVPMMALTIGAQSLAGERERKTLTYLLAQPISRVEIFVGKYLGLALSLLAALALGFGLAGLFMAFNGAGDPTAYLQLLALAFALSLIMLGIGCLISVSTSRTGVAVGVSLFLWLVFVFLGDLGLMGTAVVLRVPIANLFWMALANPLQVFKMAAIVNIQSTLDVLGPAGVYAVQRFGDQLWLLFAAVLALWALLPALLAGLQFSIRSES
ncbi:MAG: ABC transporter permease subunit [Caldilineaceae bacterium]|nr:ABC transporter permease subunit [Caldilineaceae bacterium]